MKIKYYIFGHSDYIKYALENILGNADVFYCDFNDRKSQISRMFTKATLSSKIPNVVKYVLWNVVPRKISGFKLHKNEDSGVTFIFYERNRYSHNPAFLRYLKYKNPTAKFVYIFTNLISETWLKVNSDNFNFIRSNPYYNRVITFNQHDAEKYGFEYFEFVNSRHVFVSKEPKSDVFFCGKDKGRSAKIECIYDILTKHGLICDFIVIRDETTSHVVNSNIHYLDKPIPNIKVLEYMQQSRCILDVAFDRNEPGQSLRFSEAIAYEKMLLTDNPHTFSNQYYNENQMLVFDEPSNINIEEMRKILVSESYLSPDLVSPRRLLEFIDSW